MSHPSVGRGPFDPQKILRPPRVEDFSRCLEVAVVPLHAGLPAHVRLRELDCDFSGSNGYGSK